jgi:pimeloyl-ACP methyl ester carboxylesterase
VLPDAELVTLVGAGHACQLEQPWEFDLHLLEFLDRRVGLPDIAQMSRRQT